MATVIENPTSSAAQHPTESEIIRDHQPHLRLFTAAEYYKMAEAGILLSEERVELIEGKIITMSPKSIEHAASNDRATECFRRHLGERVIVRNQNPIHLTDSSEPEPDVVLAAPQEKRYFDHHPIPSEVLLVLEVAGSSLNFDRHAKSLVYAKAGIIHHCILNLKARELEEYRDPAADGYRRKQTHTAGQSFNLVAFPELTINVNELLPPEANS